MKYKSVSPPPDTRGSPTLPVGSGPPPPPMPQGSRILRSLRSVPPPPPPPGAPPVPPFSVPLMQSDSLPMQDLLGPASMRSMPTPMRSMPAPMRSMAAPMRSMPTPMQDAPTVAVSMLDMKRSRRGGKPRSIERDSSNDIELGSVSIERDSVTIERDRSKDTERDSILENMTIRHSRGGGEPLNATLMQKLARRRNDVNVDDDIQEEDLFETLHNERDASNAIERLIEKRSKRKSLREKRRCSKVFPSAPTPTLPPTSKVKEVLSISANCLFRVLEDYMISVEDVSDFMNQMTIDHTHQSYLLTLVNQQKPTGYWLFEEVLMLKEQEVLKNVLKDIGALSLDTNQIALEFQITDFFVTLIIAFLLKVTFTENIWWSNRAQLQVATYETSHTTVDESLQKATQCILEFDGHVPSLNTRLDLGYSFDGMVVALWRKILSTIESS